MHRSSTRDAVWWPRAQIKALGGSPYEWLGEMLAAFNHGDLHAYDALCERHAAALNAQPALVEHERALREKITILCLMELIFKCAAPGLRRTLTTCIPGALQPKQAVALLCQTATNRERAFRMLAARRSSLQHRY